MAASFVVVIRVDPIDGSTAAEALHQGVGEEFLQAYLQRIVPAGSPVVIQRTVLLDDSQR